MTPTRRPITLVGVSGFARSGKDTAAKALVARGWQQRAFADALRGTCRQMNPWLPDGRRWAQVEAELGYEMAKDTAPGFRDALIDLGNAARDHIAPDVWVQAALHCLGKDPRTVVSDVRYRNEADEIRERGGVVVRVERPGVGPALNHKSETELIGYDFDLVLLNDGTPAQLGSVLHTKLQLLGLRVGEERAT